MTWLLSRIKFLWIFSLQLISITIRQDVNLIRLYPRKKLRTTQMFLIWNQKRSPTKQLVVLRLQALTRFHTTRHYRRRRLPILTTKELTTHPSFQEMAIRVTTGRCRRSGIRGKTTSMIPFIKHFAKHQKPENWGLNWSEFDRKPHKPLLTTTVSIEKKIKRKENIIKNKTNKT